MSVKSVRYERRPLLGDRSNTWRFYPAVLAVVALIPLSYVLPCRLTERWIGRLERWVFGRRVT